jgi:hypothetical protein
MVLNLQKPWTPGTCNDRNLEGPCLRCRHLAVFLRVLRSYRLILNRAVLSSVSDQ